MDPLAPIAVQLPGGRRVDAQLGEHLIQTHAPNPNSDQGSPLDLFLGAVGACAGVFVQGFCAKREIPTDTITILHLPQLSSDGTVIGVDLEVRVPPDFPRTELPGLIALVNQCSVKRAPRIQGQKIG